MIEKPTIRRTYGRTRDCKGCRYWSDQQARQEGNKPIQCLCLNRNSKLAYLYTFPDNYCDEWADGEYGAIDDPKAKGAY